MKLDQVIEDLKKTLPALGPNEYQVIWEKGPIGIAFVEDPEDTTRPKVSRILESMTSLSIVQNRPEYRSDSADIHVTIGDILIYANAYDSADYTFTKLFDIIATIDKPVILRLQKSEHQNELQETESTSTSSSPPRETSNTASKSTFMNSFMMRKKSKDKVDVDSKTGGVSLSGKAGQLFSYVRQRTVSLSKAGPISPTPDTSVDVVSPDRQRASSDTTSSRSSESTSIVNEQINSYEVEWMHGPLGILLVKANDGGNYPVVAKVSLTSMLTGVQPGDLLLRVNEIKTEDYSHDEVCKILEELSPPVSLRFRMGPRRLKYHAKAEVKDLPDDKVEVEVRDSSSFRQIDDQDGEPVEKTKPTADANEDDDSDASKEEWSGSNLDSDDEDAVDSDDSYSDEDDADSVHATNSPSKTISSRIPSAPKFRVSFSSIGRSFKRSIGFDQPQSEDEVVSRTERNIPSAETEGDEADEEDLEHFDDMDDELEDETLDDENDDADRVKADEVNRHAKSIDLKAINFDMDHEVNRSNLELAKQKAEESVPLLRNNTDEALRIKFRHERSKPPSKTFNLPTIPERDSQHEPIPSDSEFLMEIAEESNTKVRGKTRRDVTSIPDSSTYIVKWKDRRKSIGLHVREVKLSRDRSYPMVDRVCRKDCCDKLLRNILTGDLLIELNGKETYHFSVRKAQGFLSKRHRAATMKFKRGPLHSTKRLSAH